MDTYVNSVTTYLFAQSWQIGLLALIVGLISFALKNRSAHIRYLLWLIVLAKCLIPPVYSVSVPVLPDRPSIEKMSVLVSVETPLVDTKIDKADAPVEVQAAKASQKSRFALPSTKQAIVLLWLLGVLLFLLWIGFRAVRYTLWLRSRRTLLPIYLKHKLQVPFECLNFKKLPRIWLTKDIGQPFVWGLLRGSVYLPVDFTDLDSPQHNRTVMVHELSHIIRYDAAINLLQILAQAIFWFHPVVWWTNKKIRQEREKCCDEMVVAQFSTDPEHYTDAIVEALTAERQSAHPVPSLAIVGSVKDIEERIKNMLRPGKKFYKRPSVIALVIILLFAFLIVPIGCVLTNKSETKPVTEQRENTSKSLFEAIWASDPDEVKRLIANGVDVNTTNPNNPDVKYTPLMAAANGGFAKVAKVLLENGAEVNATDFQGWTALYYAFWLYSSDDNEKKHRERAELVKALIASGADVNKENQGISPLINAITTGTPRLGSIEALLDGGADIHFKDNRGLTPLYYAAFDGDRNVLDLIIERGNYADTIHLAACKGDLVRVRTLLEGGTDVNTKDEFGCTPLHWAVRARSPEVADLLITNGADVNSTAGPGNLTPLMAARKLPVIELLVSKGVDVRSQENKSKLHKACSAGDIKVVRFLIDKGADVNARNSRRSTPLCVAAASDHKEVVELLLDKGADINLSGRRGYTPLGSAARYGSKETAEFLIEKGANIHTPDNRGMTPFDLAKQWGWNDIADMFRQHGAKETLHGAVAAKDIDEVKRLIAQGTAIDAKNNVNRTPLNLACFNGYLDLVKLLVAEGADINVKDVRGQTPFWIAAGRGHSKIVEFLVDKGANINVANNQGLTPLAAARQRGHIEIVELLKKHGVEDNSAATPPKESKPVKSLHEAAANGDIDRVKVLLDQSVDIHARDDRGRTPLHLASFRNHKDIVRLLVSKGADVNAQEEPQGTPLHATALHHAVHNDNKNIVEFLIANGANVHIKDRRGQIPLDLARRRAQRRGNSEIVEILTKAAEEQTTAEKKLSMDESPAASKEPKQAKSIHQAAGNGDIDEVKALIAEGADVNATEGKKAWSPLFSAAKGAHSEVVKVLLANGADVNLTETWGYTAVYYAIWNHDEETVKALISAGLDVNKGPGNEKGEYPPLCYAIWQGHVGIVRDLLDAGADINTRDEKGYTPLYWAAFHSEWAAFTSNKDVFDLILNRGDWSDTIHMAVCKGDLGMVTTLIESGTNVNTKDEFGSTPLHWAVLADSPDVAALLIAKGANVNMKDSRSRTPLMIARAVPVLELLIAKGADIRTEEGGPRQLWGTKLHMACGTGDKDLVAFLLRQGADVNLKRKDGRTPLLHAARGGYTDVVKLLIANGAVVTIPDNRGRTALYFAEQAGHTEIVELLQEHGAKE